MSDWQAIESEVVSVLSGLASGGEPLLATVTARAVRDRKVWSEAIRRERLPAAYVMLTGREGADRASGLPGRPGLSVVLATRSFRDEDEARVGASGDGGMWSLAEQVTSALQGCMVAGTWRLVLLEERPAGGEAGTILWEQRYSLCRPAETTPPTFGGVALAGTAGQVEVEVGPVQRACSVFSFPGIDGVFERHLGVRDRVIWWRGLLRAADDAGLNALEEAIEQEVRDGEAKALTDAWGRVFESCVLRRFVRRGPRQRDALTGEAVQAFEIQFAQLGA